MVSSELERYWAPLLRMNKGKAGDGFHNLAEVRIYSILHGSATGACMIFSALVVPLVEMRTAMEPRI